MSCIVVYLHKKQIKQLNMLVNSLIEQEMTPLLII